MRVTGGIAGYELCFLKMFLSDPLSMVIVISAVGVAQLA